MAAVYLIDDEARTRTALARLLRTLGYTVQEYDSAIDFLAAPLPESGCIVLDVHMPALSGLDLQERLSAQGCRLPIVFLTGQGDIRMSVRAIKGGAEDFLTKPVSREVLTDAIGRALERGARDLADTQARQARNERLARLSGREREVAFLLAQGRLNKQVAAELGTTERTVKAHRSSIMAKLEIRSAAELARLLDGAASAPGQETRHP
jgi:FixJ family two-component response regulator